MNLLPKLAAILVPTMVVGLVVAFSLVSLFVLRDLKSIEQEQALGDIGRYRHTVLDQLQSLNATAKDWSHWTDTYRFVVGDLPTYVDVDLAPKSFAAYGLAFMVIADSNGTLVYGTGFDPVNVAYGPLPAELSTAQGRASLGIPDFGAADGNQSGLVTLHGRPYFVTAWSILTSEETGPSHGTMVWGRAVADIPLDELRQVLTGQPSWQPAAGAANGSLAGDPTTIHWTGDHVLTVQTRLDDLKGQPALVLELQQPRSITLAGYTVLELAFFASMAVLFGFLGLGLVLVDRSVVRPVAALNRRAQEIEKGSPDRSLPVGKQDEVGGLARSLESLLKGLDSKASDLEASNRDLTSFASVVSHDLQSPLSTVFLSLATLRTEAQQRGDAAALERLDRIERTAKAMSERVNALLGYARSGRAEARRVPVDAAALAAEVRHEMDSDFASSRATLDVAELPALDADPVLLKELLQNLFSNAIKYAKPGQPPAIRLSGSQSPRDVRLWVEDDGLGFQDGDVRDMLTPFKRLDRTRAIPGHGIGLAACQRLMERHGGRLEAQGQIGKGARFTLVFPRPHPQP